MSTNRKEVYCARYKHLIKGLIWVAFDNTNTLEGNIGETLNRLLSRWRHKYGQITHLTRYKGVSKTSELVMCISALRDSNNR